jgi:hypothetical protein
LPEPTYLNGFAFTVGSPQPIETLLEDGVLTAESYEDCIGRGITTFCAGNRSMAAMSASAVTDALSLSGLSTEDVPRVESQAQNCGAFSAGIEAAARQIAGGLTQHVVLVLTGNVPAGTSRYSRELGTVFGNVPALR